MTGASTHPVRQVPSDATLPEWNDASAPREGLLPAGTPAVKTRRLPRHKPKARTLTEDTGGKRQKIMMALIPVLAAALVFVLKNPLKVSSAASVQSAPPASTVAIADSDVEIAWAIPPLHLPGGRDPMRLPDPSVTPAVAEPVGGPTQARAELVVTGILYSDDRPAAIVETQLVHEGQKISGATVQKIERDGVEFEMNGRTWKQAVDK